MNDVVNDEKKTSSKEDVVSGVFAAIAVIAVVLGFMAYKHGVGSSPDRSVPTVQDQSMPVNVIPITPIPITTPKHHVVNNVSIKLNKPVLVKWVTKHSLRGKMYPRLANEIVETAMQVDDGKLTLLLLALIKQESNFYVFHKSGAGALGLGQFMPDTIKQMVEWGWLKTPQDVYDPKQHIPAIAKFLKHKGMSDNGANVDKALFNYFGGSLNPDAAKSYINKVKANIGDLVLLLMSENKENKNAGSKGNSVSDKNVQSRSVRDVKDNGDGGNNSQERRLKNLKQGAKKTDASVS